MRPRLPSSDKAARRHRFPDTTSNLFLGLASVAEEAAKEYRARHRAAVRRPTSPDDPIQSRVTQGEKQGVYIISVAARILKMHPQTLRKYERAGLVSPFRTDGMLRLYSEVDIIRLRLIKYLVVELRLNLAGVQLMLDVFNQLLKLRASIATLEGKQLKASLERTLEETFELLYSQM